MSSTTSVLPEAGTIHSFDSRWGLDWKYQVLEIPLFYWGVSCWCFFEHLFIYVLYHLFVLPVLSLNNSPWLYLVLLFPFKNHWLVFQFFFGVLFFYCSLLDLLILELVYCYDFSPKHFVNSNPLLQWTKGFFAFCSIQPYLSCQHISHSITWNGDKLSLLLVLMCKIALCGLLLLLFLYFFKFFLGRNHLRSNEVFENAIILHLYVPLSQINPVLLFTHEQMKPLMSFIQCPPFWHGEEAHSSISISQSTPVNPDNYIR